MDFRIENIEKSPDLHHMLHAGLTTRWAAALVEEALKIPFENIKSPTRKAEVVDARTLYIGICVSMGVQAATVARTINRTKAPMLYHLKRFDAMIKLKSEAEFRDKFLKIINLKKVRMSNTINKDGKTYVSADILETVIKDTLEAMGLPSMLQELKAKTTAEKEPELTEEQKKELQHTTAINDFIKNQTEQPLAGKEI